MTANDGLVHALLLDGQGGARTLDWDEVHQWQASDGILWLHLNFDMDATNTWLQQHSKLDSFVIEALTATEPRPRRLTDTNGMLLTLRGVNLNPAASPEDMVSIRLWMETNRLISTRRRPLLSVQDVRSALEARRGPKTTAEIVINLADALIERINTVIDQLEDKIDVLEARVLARDNDDLGSQLATHRSQMISLRRYLAPQRDALTRIDMDDNNLFTRRELAHMHEVADRMIRCLETLDAIRDRTASAQEESLRYMSERMENRMYALTVIAAIFLPLSFATGLLGMNVGGLPGTTSTHAFFWVCTGLAALGIGLYVFFKRRKWL